MWVVHMEITKLRSELFVTLEQVTVLLQRAQEALTTLRRRVAYKPGMRKLLRRGQHALTTAGRRVASKPRRLQEALRARENGLRMLLASSTQALVVINVDRRLVGANPKGLDLFGISEANMNNFAIDAFLSHGEIPKFDVNNSSLRKRAEKHGTCEIRRLDGSLRVAEYSFVAHFAPFRHLCKFRDVTALNQYQPSSLRTLKRSVRPVETYEPTRRHSR